MVQSPYLAPLPFPPSGTAQPSDAVSPPISRTFQLVLRSGRPTARSAADSALFQLAENVDEAESLWLEINALCDANRSVALCAGLALRHSSSAGKAGSIEGRLRDFQQALSFDYPGCEIVPFSDPEHRAIGHNYSIQLRGIPVLLADLSGAVDLDLLADTPKEPSGPRHVVLGGCLSESSLSDALLVLQLAARPISLRLTFRPRRLSSRELRKLSDLYRELAEVRASQLITSSEIARTSGLTALVAEWLAAKSGVELSMSLSSDQVPDECLMSALATAFSLPPSARRDSIDPEIDLSGCFVRGQKRPSLALDENVSRNCTLTTLTSLHEAADAPKTPLGLTDGGIPVRLDDKSRSRHVIVCGATGTGKSTLLKNLISSDVQNGHAVVLIDPHGDLYQDVLTFLNRDPDLPVWTANTSDLEAPYSLNLLQSAGDSYRQNFVCNQLIRLLKRSLYKNVPEGFGPMFEAYFRNAFLLLSDGGEGRFTISDMDRIFADAGFRRELLEDCGNEHVRRFWRGIATKAGGEAALENIAPYIVSKLTQFVGNPVISPIVCSRESTMDFGVILESGGVCLVNLAKGQVGVTESEILGGIFTTALFSAALARGSRNQENRRTVRVYLDEFQSYAGEIISEMLAECRKYGLEMTLATQSLSRLKIMNGDLTHSVLGNAGNIIAMRSGPHDADLLADWIGGGTSREDVMTLDDFRAIGRFLDQGRVSRPARFTLEDCIRTGTGLPVRGHQPQNRSQLDSPF